MMEGFESMWDSIEIFPTEQLDNNFENIAPKFLEFLICSLLKYETIDIGTMFGKIKGSVISYDIYNTDKQILLKLLPKEIFELEVSFWNLDNNEKNYTYQLSDKDLKIIPEGLLNLMRDAFKKKKTLVFNKGSLNL